MNERESEQPTLNQSKENDSSDLLIKGDSPIVNLVVENEIEIAGRNSPIDSPNEDLSDVQKSGANAADISVTSVGDASSASAITDGETLTSAVGIDGSTADESTTSSTSVEVDTNILSDTCNEKSTTVADSSVVDTSQTSDNIEGGTDTCDAGQPSDEISDNTFDSTTANSLRESSSPMSNNPNSDPSSCEDTTDSISPSCDSIDPKREVKTNVDCDAQDPATNSRGDGAALENCVSSEDCQKTTESQSTDCKINDSLPSSVNVNSSIPSVPVGNSPETLAQTQNSTSQDRKKPVQQIMHERESFKNRIGSLRKSKKAQNEFLIEIFESKKPRACEENNDGNNSGFDLVEEIRRREGRAQSEPPELKSVTPSSVCFEISHSNLKKTGNVDVTCKPSASGDEVSKLNNILAEGKDGSLKLRTVPLDSIPVSLITSGIDVSTTLSQTSESSSGVTGDLTSSGKHNSLSSAADVLNSYNKSIYMYIVPIMYVLT